MKMDAEEILKLCSDAVSREWSKELDRELVRIMIESITVDRESYERDLKRRQEEHLKNVRDWNWQPCLHDACPECVGTGIRRDGTPCVHSISCPCPKCSPRCMSSIT